jgi:methyl-accepting chemotaxis protein
MSVKVKLLLGFLCVAILVIVAGVTGIVMMGSVVKSTETVIEDKLPMKDASMEALIDVERAISESRNYVNSRRGLGVIRSSIENSLGGFEGEIGKIQQNAEGGARSLSEKALSEFTAFKSATMELVNAHDQRTTYLFEHDGVEYDIKGFFYYLGVRYGAWMDTLDDSSKYGVKFKGGLDVSKSDFAVWYQSYNTTDSALAKKLQKFDKLNKNVYKSAIKIDKAKGEKKLSYYERAKSRHFNKAKKEIGRLQNYVAPIYDTLKREEMASLIKMEASAGNIRATLVALEEAIDGEVEAAEAGAMSSKKSANTILIATIIISVIVAILIAIFSANRITGPLKRAVDVADRLSDGDLDLEITVKGTDETGKLMSSMKHMVEKLRTIILGVQDASNNVMNNSRELSAGSEHMSMGVAEQTEKANMVATSSSEMSVTIAEIAKNATEIASFTSTTSKEANDGKAIVDRTVKEVKGIEAKVSESAEMVATLGKRSEEIGEIVGVINDIADQTNLLALNAAIEAARAGEQGRGFAVVADEVRKLAERTTSATKKIEEMIGAMQSETNKTVSSMDESIKMCLRADERHS